MDKKEINTETKSSILSKLQGTYMKDILTLLLGIAAFCFWRFTHPFVLTWHEEMQIFIMDQTFLQEHLGYPGGIARYIGEFLVQFYNNINLGAFIIALIYMLIQRLTWKGMEKASTLRIKDTTLSATWYALSFIPSFILWFLMGDSCVMMTYMVAILLSLTAIISYPHKKLARGIYLLLILPIGYWIVGPAIFMLALFAILASFIRPQTLFTAVGATAVILCGSIFCVLMSAHLAPYPLERLIRGIDYYRMPLHVCEMQLVLLLILPMLIISAYYFPRLSKNREKATGIALSVTILVGSWLIIPSGFGDKEMESLKYDLFVRTNNWEAILKQASEQEPETASGRCALNLALWKTKQMSSEEFRGFLMQVGSMMNDNYVPIVLSDIYFETGMISVSQRFAFESIELISNYNKSARLLQRLVETNMLNGQYEVARKYARILQRTAIYRQWADRMMELIDHPQLINQHPLYGPLRKAAPKDNYMFV